jgi:hypothetical protein
MSTALELQDDRQAEGALRAGQLEHEVGAELDGDELIERRLHHRHGGVRRKRHVEEELQEVWRERRVLAKQLDQTIVLERRHASTLPIAPGEFNLGAARMPQRRDGPPVRWTVHRAAG